MGVLNNPSPLEGRGVQGNRKSLMLTSRDREGAVMGPPNTAVLVHRVDRLLTRAARWSDLRLPWVDVWKNRAFTPHPASPLKGRGVIQNAPSSKHDQNTRNL